MDGYGDIYMCGPGDGSRSDVLINEPYLDNGKQQRAARANPVMFVGAVYVDLEVGFQHSSLIIHGCGQLTIAPDVQRVWGKYIKGWLNEKSITHDHEVWPLIAERPADNFTAMLWSTVRDPANTALAYELMREKPRDRAMTANCPMYGQMNIDNVRKQKQNRTGY